MSINIDGREYEVVETKVSLRKGDLIVRPVKQEPKYTVDMRFWDYHRQSVSSIAVEFDHELPLDQAQLIKECIEKMMEYLMGGADFKDSYFSEVPLPVKARQSMRENN